MKLTGKAKELFDEWFASLHTPRTFHLDFILKEFCRRPNSMQWGVYQDWADSLKIDIIVVCSWDYSFFYYEIDDKSNLNDVVISVNFQTRPEARTAALEKLNQLVNEKG